MTRFFDIVISLFIVVLLSPLMALIALFIKLDSKGPVIYRQKRVGKNGLEFFMFKFRSMYTESDKHGLLTVGTHDPRITKAGLILRKYKLDELPQLFNVLIGDMSIVGPRPEVKRYVDCYTEEQRAILLVRPGITDIASVTFKDENDILKLQSDPEKYYIEHILPAKIQLNRIFITSPTISRYFSIIFLTIKKVLG
jgi:lipopolysaccharide/colanic/teichoic acid biosynthesis glycosyltransferase